MAIHRTQDAGVDAGGSGIIGPDEWNDAHAFDMLCTLGKYTTNASGDLNYDVMVPSKGLGIALLDMTYITHVRFGVYYNKGTPGMNFQLWNHTNGTEVGVIVDTGAAGEKVLDSGAIDVTGMGMTGLKLLRIRNRYTSNTGQAFNYYGSFLRAVRA